MNSEIEGTSKMIYLTGVKDGMGGEGGGEYCSLLRILCVYEYSV